MTGHPALLEGALGLAARGIPVIPLRPRSKVPVHAGWPKLGMIDPESISLEWRLNPDANVGVLCGPDALDGRGLVVVDVDGHEGRTELRALEAAHCDIPPAVTVRTPHDGWHHYYQGHAASWNPAHGVEVRSVGRQCAAPPSTLTDGKYEWATDGDFAPLPDWLTHPLRREQPTRHVDAPRGLRDPVLEIPPPRYFQALTGMAPDRHGFVSCPVHPFPDIEPSCKVYPTAERGWFCYGAECQKGGDVVTLAARLAGVPTPVRGHSFIACLDYLRGLLL